MDCPAGSICRIIDSKVYHFPANPEKILEGLIPIFQLVWKAKSIMESTIDLIDTNGPSEEVNLVTVVPPPCCITLELYIYNLTGYI
jgi:hypothetical protein